MFIKPVTQPILRQGWQVEHQLHETQRLEDFKVASGIHDHVRATAAKLFKGQRFACLVSKPSTRLRIGKEVIETITQLVSGKFFLEYSRKLPVSGREKLCHKSSSFKLVLHGVARLGPCLSARPLVSRLDPGIEFLAWSHWAEERENHHGS
jgi:hypothetical protein